MKRSIKSYLVFTSLVYRAVVFLLLPGALLAGAGIFPGWLTVVAAAALLPVAEVMADYWLFGGIQAGGVKLEYLMTSDRGTGILRRALALDLVRKFLTAAVVMAGCRILGGMPGSGAGWIGSILYPVLVSYFFTTAGLFLSRYGVMLWVNMVVGEAAAVLAAFSFVLPGLQEYMWGYILLFAAAGILTSILTVRTAVKKVEGGYYDK